MVNTHAAVAGMVHGGKAALAAARFQVEASRAHEGDPTGGGVQTGSSRRSAHARRVPT